MVDRAKSRMFFVRRSLYADFRTGVIWYGDGRFAQFAGMLKWDVEILLDLLI